MQWSTILNFAFLAPQGSTNDSDLIGTTFFQKIKISAIFQQIFIKHGSGGKEEIEESVEIKKNDNFGTSRIFIFYKLCCFLL